MFYQDIKTKRLWLKNLSREDDAFMLRQFSDTAVNQYLFDAEPLASLEEANALIDFYLQPEPRLQHRWIIRLRETGEQIGTCGLHCYSREARCVDVGYDLQAAFWGRGLMAEAMNEVLRLYAPKLGVERVFAHIAVENERSIRLAEKLGFVFRGETETLSFHGREYLHHIYELDVPNWQTRPAPNA